MCEDPAWSVGGLGDATPLSAEMCTKVAGASLLLCSGKMQKVLQRLSCGTAHSTWGIKPCQNRPSGLPARWGQCLQWGPRPPSVLLLPLAQYVEVVPIFWTELVLGPHATTRPGTSGNNHPPDSWWYGRALASPACFYSSISIAYVWKHISVPLTSETPSSRGCWEKPLTVLHGGRVQVRSLFSPPHLFALSWEHVTIGADMASPPISTGECAEAVETEHFI